ncbi:MAG TPA: right-handed parallel beta-helix repeat-containing protein [Candidatus Binatia bacterium]|nr:right-handed parallel beta-helix repeat-containing protein [Candidatus Binatia bacterium]
MAGSGGDFTSIQQALDAAAAGDTILVREKATPYFEKVAFPRSGSAGAGPIALEAWPGEHPIVDGTGVAGDSMVLVEDRSWVRIAGLELRNNLGLNDGSGIRVVGAGSHVEIRDNVIHDMRGRSAMAITVYGTRAQPISDLVIAGNVVRDCDPAPSEAITLNGNVDGFEVSGNLVRDVNNIGIVFIGGESDIQPDAAKVARNGVCRDNRVERARSSYGGGFAGGIYVDGARDLVIERNFVTESDLGLEVGAENPGIVATGVVVRDNVLYANDKAGLVFGGFAASVGRVRSCEFRNNTVVGNDTLGAGFGELWIQWAEDNVVRNNVFVATAQALMIESDVGNGGNALDHNVWFAPGGAAAARFVWNGTEHVGFGAYRSATGQDPHSLFDDPLLVAPAGGDFHLRPTSPAINAGDPATAPDPGEVDLDGAPRVSGPRIDAGADEVTCGDGLVNPGEECDDGDAVDGDGCDSNCTATRCGNGIVTAGEACDDGNLAGGDCCDAACALEPPGSTCDDGDPCTRSDACSAGACAGSVEPEPVCRAAARSSLVLRNRAPDVLDSLAWRWTRGAETALPEFGNPLASGPGLTLCLYDGTGSRWSVALRTRLPAGGTCSGKPCWKAQGSAALRYADRAATPEGVTSAVLRAGADEKAGIAIIGKGADLRPPALPLASAPAVAIQLRSADGDCWGATFAAPPDRNDTGQYKASWP